MKQFIFKDNNYDGLFNYFRSSKPSLISYVHTSSVSSNIDDFFCADGYYGRDPSALIDGIPYSSWCNYQFVESEQEVKLDIGSNTFILKTLVLTTPCLSPKRLQVLGSNDDDIYDIICDLEDFQEDYSTSNNTCYNGFNSYRLFKFKQIGENIGSSMRLHISEVEFFGVLNPYQTETCNQQSKNVSITLIFIIIIFK